MTATIHLRPRLKPGPAVKGDRMRGMAFAAVAALALAGCTGAHVKKPAVCDGKHRRPANLYGSVLPSLPIDMSASQAAAQSMVAPGPGPGPQPLPAPPVAPTPTPAPVFPPPDAATPPAPPATSGATTPAAPRRTSQRTVALSYLPC